MPASKKHYSEVSIKNHGHLEYKNANGWNCSANFVLEIIRIAWDSGCSFEEEADGYGAGQGTMGDWSGIRDSSEGATATMLAKALNHIKTRLRIPIE